MNQGLRSRTALALTTVVALALAACTHGAGSVPLAPSAPRFVIAPCPVAPPEGQMPANLVCGHVTVPQDRAKPGGLQLSLEVAVLKATGPTPQPDPVFYIGGGPGFGVVQRDLTHFTATFAAPVQTARDIVFFDQRGTGLSSPVLTCPEVTAEQRRALARDDNSPFMPVGPVYDRGLFDCRHRLAQDGIDFKMYSSSVIASDIADIAHALGYTEYNLYGVSYGTRVALTALRDDPGAIRSVVLDSVLPPQVSPQLSIGANFERALNSIAGACTAQAACATGYRDGNILDLVAAAEGAVGNDHPVVPATSASGESIDVHFGAERFLHALFRYAYSTQSLAALPKMLKAIAAHDFSALAPLAKTESFSDDTDAVAMNISVNCNEEIPFYDEKAAEAADANVVFYIQDAFSMTKGSILKDTLAMCYGWDNAKPPAIENEPVTSDVPALVLSGELDPITPPDWGRLAASTLSRSTFVEFPGTAHGIIEGQPVCGMSVIGSFLADPAAPPDRSCVAKLGEPQFLLP